MANSFRASFMLALVAQRPLPGELSVLHAARLGLQGLAEGDAGIFPASDRAAHSPWSYRAQRGRTGKAWARKADPVTPNQKQAIQQDAEREAVFAFKFWANDHGYDVAYTYDTERSRWVWFNPMTADLFEVWKAALEWKCKKQDDLAPLILTVSAWTCFCDGKVHVGRFCERCGRNAPTFAIAASQDGAKDAKA